MARYRKTAIAALAASALLLTPTAAYADHKHHSVGGSSEGGMSWATYSGKLTDFSTTPDIFKDATASALMISIEGNSYFRLRVSGVGKDAVGGPDYGVHLHEGKCQPGDGTAAGPHYNITPYDLVAKVYELVSNETEVWLDVDVNSDGYARSTATVPFVPKPGERSIVLHAIGTQPNGSAGTRLACLPFNIKSYGN